MFLTIDKVLDNYNCYKDFVSSQRAAIPVVSCLFYYRQIEIKFWKKKKVQLTVVRGVPFPPWEKNGITEPSWEEISFLVKYQHFAGIFVDMYNAHISATVYSQPVTRSFMVFIHARRIPKAFPRQQDYFDILTSCSSSPSQNISLRCHFFARNRAWRLKCLGGRISLGDCLNMDSSHRLGFDPNWIQTKPQENTEHAIIREENGSLEDKNFWIIF